MKRFLSFFFALCATVASWGYTYMDENGICYDNFDSYAKTASVTYYSSNTSDNANHYIGDIVIPSKITFNNEEYTVTRIAYHAFWSCGNVNSISIPNSITRIESDAFLLPNLKAVYIEDLNSWCNIVLGNYNSIPSSQFVDFYINGNLVEELTLPEGLTTIKDYTFMNWRTLKKVNFPASLTSIGKYAFSGCSNLKSIDLPIGITHLGDGAFYSTGLISFTLPEGVSTISYALLSNCEKLISVNLHQNLNSIGEYAFNYCKSLTEIVIPNSVTEIGKCAFEGCSSLVNVVLSESISELKDKTFEGCDLLEELNVPSNVTKITGYPFGNINFLNFNSINPPLTTDSPFNNQLLFVPDNSVDSYKSNWPGNSKKIFGKSTQTSFEITAVANSLNSDVVNKINSVSGLYDAMLNVVKLKISGTINGYDFMAFRDKMLNLRELDLSEASIVYDKFKYYDEYHTEDNVLGDYCFYELGITKVILPQTITRIGNSAFRGSHLREIEMLGDLKIIGTSAFENCGQLRSIKWNNGLEEIGARAFYQSTYPYHLNLPESLKIIGRDAFHNSAISGVSFPPHLEEIGDQAFYWCYNITDISLPTSLKIIGNGALCLPNLKTIKIPASVQHIGDDAFSGPSITDIYTWTIIPVSIEQNTFSSNTYLNATLHVPAASQKNYYWGERWSQFQNITSFNEPYEYFYLPATEDLVMNEDDQRIKGEDDGEGNVTNPDADFNPGSGLIVEGDEGQNLGEVNLESNGSDNTASIVGGNSTTETSGANVNIDKLNIKIEITKNKWYFFAFPFDIEYSNIHFNGQFVWRYYDGEFRAEHGSGAWKNHEGQLVRGKGYIFQGSKDGTLTLTVENASIDGNDKMLALESHEANDPQNASWNFVGNPFTSYYELTDLAYNAPVTVYNGSTYVAYSSLDDDLTLHPFQAFFVQSPGADATVGFKAEFRETKNQSEDADVQSAVKARRMARSSIRSDRKVVNIEVSDGETADATRVVFNPEKSEGYELECDAAKFISNAAPQIYSLDSRGTQYAINERPESAGNVQLGFIAQHDGQFTIKATRLDCGMTLIDHVTGARIDLSQGEYSFSANAGATNARFELVKTGNQETAIEGVTGVEGAASIYGIDGIRRDNAPAGKGIYIVKRGGKTQKVINLSFGSS